MKNKEVQEALERLNGLFAHENIRHQYLADLALLERHIKTQEKAMRAMLHNGRCSYCKSTPKTCKDEPFTLCPTDDDMIRAAMEREGGSHE